MTETTTIEAPTLWGGEFAVPMHDYTRLRILAGAICSYLIVNNLSGGSPRRFSNPCEIWYDVLCGKIAQAKHPYLCARVGG